MKLNHTHFFAHAYSKMISYILYKNILHTRFCLQIHLYVLYQSLFKSIFVKIIIPLFFCPKLVFRPEPVDQAVDRIYVRFGRSTVPVDRRSGCARIRVHVLSVDRTVDLTVVTLLSVRLGRPGGRPDAYNGQIFERAVDRTSR